MVQFLEPEHGIQSIFNPLSEVVAMASNIILSNSEYKVVGTRPIRHDGTDKVTGRAKYGGDFSASDLLHGKVLRSPHAHANIKSIDISKALAYPELKP